MDRFIDQTHDYQGLKKSETFCKIHLNFTYLMFLFSTFAFVSPIYSQTSNFAPNSYQQTYNNYPKSSVFRQEIARFQIYVVREGKNPLPITQVPRVQQGDILKVKLLDEPVNGIKIDQTQWDWTFLVAFINPLRRMKESSQEKKQLDEPAPVSEEIQFRKQGWYKEYSFTVPYDSQPVFFLYPRPKYRKQILKVVNSKYDEIRKLGEKTIELADAYGQINNFLSELQFVLNRNAQMYGYGYGTSNNPGYNNGSFYNYPNNTYSYGYPYNPANPNNGANVPLFGLQTVPALNQLVEGLAKSFNIQLPSCWGNGSSYSNYGNYGSGYNSGYSSGYNSGYSNYGYNSGYSGYSGYGNNNQMMDFVSRTQCVARNVNLQDFDISVTKMWQQGGVFLAAELQKKYPQIAYWINIAAVAIDFIVKVFQKSPLRIVPSIIQSSDNPGQSGNLSGGGYGNSYSSFSSNQYSANTYTSNNQIPRSLNVEPLGKISLFADSQPTQGQFVTAYPIVAHKWQANPDPEVISLYPPILAEPCLHAGPNLLKSTDLSDQYSQDTYSRDFKLVMSSVNGFKKEFSLKKNIGLGAWELNITPEEMNQIPKVNMTLEAELQGMRGFNQIKSPKFNLPISLGGSYEITAESQKNFTVGGKRKITLRNSLGSCRCLQSVIYKLPTGGQFVFEAVANPNGPNALQYSVDGKEVSFEIDTSSFQPGVGTLEIKTYGGETEPTRFNQTGPQAGNNLTLKLYPEPPVISEIKARRGDREIVITGDKLEQIQSLSLNGKRMIVKGNSTSGSGFNQGSTMPAGTVNSPNPNPTNPATSIPKAFQNPRENQFQSSANSVVSTTNQSASQLQNISNNQRIAVFEDNSNRINSDFITLELNLEDSRYFSYPTRFSVGLSRPSIKVNEQNEIEGDFLSQPFVNVQNDQVMVTPSLNKSKSRESQIDLSNYPVVSTNKMALTVGVQNTLTDYSFRLENLLIETRIENSTSSQGDLPSIKFDVLDTDNLRLNFSFSQLSNKALSGRRLQFRIRDRERGDSDWYTIKQTFVRIPLIESVKCTNEMNNQCELKGEGLDYVGLVSVDGGRNWSSNNLQVQLTEDGKNRIMIPFLIHQNFLQIKLRDFPRTEGLIVSKFTYSNTVRKTTKTKVIQGNNPAQLNEQNQPLNQSVGKPSLNQTRGSDSNGTETYYLRLKVLKIIKTENPFPVFSIPVTLFFSILPQH